MCDSDAVQLSTWRQSPDRKQSFMTHSITDVDSKSLISPLMHTETKATYLSDLTWMVPIVLVRGSVVSALTSTEPSEPVRISPRPELVIERCGVPLVFFFFALRIEPPLCEAEFVHSVVYDTNRFVP